MQLSAPNPNRWAPLHIPAPWGLELDRPDSRGSPSLCLSPLSLCLSPHSTLCLSPHLEPRFIQPLHTYSPRLRSNWGPCPPPAAPPPAWPSSAPPAFRDSWSDGRAPPSPLSSISFGGQQPQLQLQPPAQLQLQLQLPQQQQPPQQYRQSPSSAPSLQQNDLLARALRAQVHAQVQARKAVALAGPPAGLQLGLWPPHGRGGVPDFAQQQQQMQQQMQMQQQKRLQQQLQQQQQEQEQQLLWMGDAARTMKQKRCREQEEERMLQQQRDAERRVSDAQALAQENAELRKRARMLESVLLIRDVQIETLRKIELSPRNPPHALAMPIWDGGASLRGSPDTSSTGSGAALPPRLPRPDAASAPQSASSSSLAAHSARSCVDNARALRRMSQGAAMPRSSLGTRSGVSDAAAYSHFGPLPVLQPWGSFGNGARSGGLDFGAGGGGGGGGGGDCGADDDCVVLDDDEGDGGAAQAGSFCAMFNEPEPAAEAPLPLTPVRAEEEAADASGAATFEDTQYAESVNLVCDFTGDDVRRLWVAFTHEASACLGLLGGSGGGTPAVHARLSASVGRVAAVMRHVKTTKPAVRDSLVGLDLQTGQQAPKAAPASHWRGVMAALGLNAQQQRDTHSMCHAFRQHVTEVLAERQTILAQLRDVGGAAAGEDGLWLDEEPSPFVFNSAQPSEILLADLLDASTREEKRLGTLVSTSFMRQLQPVQYALLAVHSYPRFPNVLALVEQAAGWQDELAGRAGRTSWQDPCRGDDPLVAAVMGGW